MLDLSKPEELWNTQETFVKKVSSTLHCDLLCISAPLELEGEGSLVIVQVSLVPGPFQPQVELQTCSMAKLM